MYIETKLEVFPEPSIATWEAALYVRFQQDKTHERSGFVAKNY